MSGITWWIYPNPPCGCAIWLRLLKAYPNAKYGLRGDETIIVLSAYIDALVK